MKKRKGFIFTDKKHSNRAVMAAVLGAISLASLGIMVFLSALYSTVGLILGLVTLQEKEYFRLFPVLGIVLNLLALLSVGLIIYAGGSLA